MSEGIWIAIITAISSIVINILTSVKNSRDNSLKDIKKDINTIKDNLKNDSEGTKMLIADKLKFLCSKAISQGSIDYDSLRIVENLYNSYHNLGGNGFMTDIMERVKKLPIR